MSMTESTKTILFEASMLLEEARRNLVRSSGEEKEALVLVPKAVSNVADVLALLQDEVLGDAKVVGLDFPTITGAKFQRVRNG